MVLCVLLSFFIDHIDQFVFAFDHKSVLLFIKDLYEYDVNLLDS